LGSKKIKTLFGFSDSILGDHVERGYQALALNETRADFVPFALVVLSPARSNLSLEQQQVPPVRRRAKEKSSLEAGTINVTTMNYKLLRFARSVGLLVSTNVIPSVAAIDIPVPNQGCHSDVSGLDCYGSPGVFTLSIDWRRL